MNIARFRCHAWALAAAALAGCGSPPSPSQAPLLLPQTSAREPRATASYLYAGQCCNHAGGRNVTLYDLGLTGVARRITKGISSPNFITTDRSGRLYVTNRYYSTTVTEYDRGATSPSRRIKLPNAYAMATDGSNNLYVTVCPTCALYGRGKGSVAVYKAGTTKLLRTITDGIDIPISVAVDTNGNLYVLNGDYGHSDVTVYAPGSSKPLRTLSRDVSSPSTIALDATNDLFVLNNAASNWNVVEFAPDSDKILRQIKSGLDSPQAMVIDGGGTLYVSNTSGPRGFVSVYASGGYVQSYEITDRVEGPIALAVDAENNLYVANDGYYTPPRDRGTICVYAQYAQKALRCVRGPRKFDFPTSMVVGP